MRLLADENVPSLMVETLQSLGHDVAWIRTTAPSAPDIEILAQANSQDRVLLTYDTDFGELIFRRQLRSTSGVILLRLPQPTRLHADRVVEVLNQYNDWSDYFTTISAERVRRRPLPRRQ